MRRAAAKPELGSLRERRPLVLSGSRRQRVAMASATMRQPAMFLMDEQLSGLDVKLLVSTRAHIASRTHSDNGLHDQVEAMTLTDREVAMNSSAFQQSGHAARDPRHGW